MSDKVQHFFRYVVQGTDFSDAQVTWLVQKDGVDINVTDKLGCNAAHYAAVKNRLDLLHWLAEHGIDVNRQDQRGRTPLHITAERGRAELVDVLMHHGAMPCLGMLDKEGNTPLHLAAMYCELPTLRALLAFGADPTTPDKCGRTPEQVAGTGKRNLPDLPLVQLLLSAQCTEEHSEEGSDDKAGSTTSSSVASTTQQLHPAAPKRHPGRGSAEGAARPPAPAASDKPEHMVLTIHLARKVTAMVAELEASGACCPPPFLALKMETVEPLLHSLHRSLLRQEPPGDIEDFLGPVMETLVELWHVVEKASKPASGIAARLKLSLTSGGSTKATAELARLDNQLHGNLEGISSQLVAYTAEKAALRIATSTISDLTSTMADLPAAINPFVTPPASPRAAMIPEESHDDLIAAEFLDTDEAPPAPAPAPPPLPSPTKASPAATHSSSPPSAPAAPMRSSPGGSAPPASRSPTPLWTPPTPTPSAPPTASLTSPRSSPVSFGPTATCSPDRPRRVSAPPKSPMRTQSPIRASPPTAPMDTPMPHPSLPPRSPRFPSTSRVPPYPRADAPTPTNTSSASAPPPRTFPHAPTPPPTINAPPIKPSSAPVAIPGSAPPPRPGPSTAPPLPQPPMINTTVPHPAPHHPFTEDSPRSTLGEPLPFSSPSSSIDFSASPSTPPAKAHRNAAAARHGAPPAAPSPRGFMRSPRIALLFGRSNINALRTAPPASDTQPSTPSSCSSRTPRCDPPATASSSKPPAGPSVRPPKHPYGAPPSPTHSGRSTPKPSSKARSISGTPKGKTQTVQADCWDTFGVVAPPMADFWLGSSKPKKRSSKKA